MSDTAESDGDFSFLFGKPSDSTKRAKPNREKPTTMAEIEAQALEKLQQEYLWRHTFIRRI